MENINLNAGGFIGAFIGGTLPAGIYLAVGAEFRPKLVVSGVVAGAVAGTYLWSRMLGAADQPKDDQKKNDEMKKKWLE